MNRRTALLSTAGLAMPWLNGCASGAIAPSTSERAFRIYAAKRGLNIDAFNASSLTSTTIGFYREVSVTGLNPERGDKLLFQWGTYDWGAGSSFEFDITRQFIALSGNDDSAISQLRVTAHYEPTPTLTSIKNGNIWCQSQNESQAFELLIRRSACFAAVQALPPRKVTVAWGQV